MRELILKNLDQEINLETCLAVNPNLVLRVEDDDCALLYDPDRGSVQMLNKTAVAIWQNIDGQRSLNQVIEGLHDQFEGMDEPADPCLEKGRFESVEARQRVLLLSTNGLLTLPEWN